MAAWAQGNTVAGESSVWTSQGALAHEISHVLDSTVLPRIWDLPDPEFSSSAYWRLFRSAVEKDPYWVSEYGRDNSIAEVFAEVGRLSIFNKNVEGKLLGARVNSTLIANQLAAYEKVVGDINVRGGRCTAEKVQSSKPVPRDGTAQNPTTPAPNIKDTGKVLPVIAGPIHILIV